ncbi:MAG TPA: MFS transporter [Pseudonocardiaceae bacterium]|jgi:EmrB/QacA subfamily drug resistance transporter
MTSTPHLPRRMMPARSTGDRRHGSARWIALMFIALAQLMIALDATIVNIALPSVQAALGFTDADRQWVITAYTVSFGGLLLLGGRIADHIGRTRAFVIGLAGFAVASAVGGLATDLTVLTAARAAQGAFGALLGPTVLALLAVTFTEPRERGTAFAIFGAIAGGGGAVGLVLGGVLTESFSWRACLFVNVPIALVAAVGAWYLRGSTRASNGTRLDIPGAALATAGLVALVLACTRAAALGWSSALVIGLLGAGGALLALFALRESRAASPLLPLRILADRNRVGAYLSVAFAVAGMLGLFLFLTYYLQVVLGYSPVTAGLAFLPLSAAVLLSAQLVAGRLLPRVAPRVLIVPGLLVAAAAMVLLTRLTPGSGYATAVLPAEILLGLGMGSVFTPAISTATSAVATRDAGVAAAVVNTAQQVGGSLGVAVLNTVAAGAALRYLGAHPDLPAGPTAALVHGYTTAAGLAAAILTAAAVLAAVLINAGPPAHPRPTSPARSTS